MIKFILPAAVAALALGAPAVAHAQLAQPMPPAMPNNNMTNANAVIVGQPQPGPNDANQTYAQPMPGVYGQPMQPISPRTTWIPGPYDWDPATSNYVYTDGQYIEAPRENAQWLPGHWAQTPTAWIWINGGWN
jgi:hypothetical protein